MGTKAYTVIPPTPGRGFGVIGEGRFCDRSFGLCGLARLSGIAANIKEVRDVERIQCVCVLLAGGVTWSCSSERVTTSQVTQTGPAEISLCLIL